MYDSSDIWKCIIQNHMSGCIRRRIILSFYRISLKVNYHHILDPRTGYPYENGLVQVSIISPRSIDGDGLSTTCFALGLEKGRELIESMEGIYGVFITQDGGLHYTDGAEDFLYNE